MILMMTMKLKINMIMQVFQMIMTMITIIMMLMMMIMMTTTILIYVYDVYIHRGNLQKGWIWEAKKPPTSQRLGPPAAIAALVHGIRPRPEFKRFEGDSNTVTPLDLKCRFSFEQFLMVHC